MLGFHHQIYGLDFFFLSTGSHQIILPMKQNLIQQQFRFGLDWMFGLMLALARESKALV